MVVSVQPIMKSEKSIHNNRRRNKILVVLIVACVTLAGYYLFSYSRENTNLINKQIKLIIQLKKYGAAYGKCKTSLETSKSDAVKFHDSNLQLQEKVGEQEEGIANCNKMNNETSTKLDGAYQFFHNILELLGYDKDEINDKQLPQAAVVVIKQNIQDLKSDSVELQKLRKSKQVTMNELRELKAAHDVLTSSHLETTNALNELKTVHEELTARSIKLETFAKTLFKNNELLEKKLAENSATLERRTKEAAQLADKQLSKTLSSPPVNTDNPPESVELQPVEASINKETEADGNGMATLRSGRIIQVVQHAPQNKTAPYPLSSPRADIDRNTPTKSLSEVVVTKRDEEEERSLAEGGTGVEEATEGATGVGKWKPVAEYKREEEVGGPVAAERIPIGTMFASTAPSNLSEVAAADDVERFDSPGVSNESNVGDGGDVADGHDVADGSDVAVEGVYGDDAAEDEGSANEEEDA